MTQGKTRNPRSNSIQKNLFFLLLTRESLRIWRMSNKRKPIEIRLNIILYQYSRITIINLMCKLLLPQPQLYLHTSRVSLNRTITSIPVSDEPWRCKHRHQYIIREQAINKHRKKQKHGDPVDPSIQRKETNPLKWSIQSYMILARYRDGIWCRFCWILVNGRGRVINYRSKFSFQHQW